MNIGLKENTQSNFFFNLVLAFIFHFLMLGNVAYSSASDLEFKYCGGNAHSSTVPMDKKLKIVSFNIRSSLVSTLDTLVKGIRGLDADFIFLQEVESSPRTFFKNVAEALAEK